MRFQYGCHVCGAVINSDDRLKTRCCKKAMTCYPQYRREPLLTAPFDERLRTHTDTFVDRLMKAQLCRTTTTNVIPVT